MMAHTAGPWVHDDFIAGRIIGPDNVSICDVHGSAARAEEDDANQMLICAAPDLLEALKYLLSQTIEMDERYGIALTEGEHEAALLARAAIRKAKGAAE